MNEVKLILEQIATTMDGAFCCGLMNAPTKKRLDPIMKFHTPALAKLIEGRNKILPTVYNNDPYRL